MKNFNTREAGLKKADRVEITTIVDNYTNTLLASSENKNDIMTRATEKYGGERAPLAEHGLSLLIRLFSGNQVHVVLFDGGRSKTAIRYNLRLLNINLTNLEAVVLSHGHGDHYGGLFEVPRHIQKSGVPLIVHPDAFLSHYRKQSDGTMLKRKRLYERSLEKAGFHVVKSRSHQLLASKLVLSTGEVERTTEFETIPGEHYIERDGKLEPDIIRDDQSLVINLKEKGLVVISGCAHSGIINTIRYAMKINQTDRVYAVIGGFHLAGQGVEAKTEKTMKAFAEINPAIVVPMHCSSWYSIVKIYQEMPESFILNCVGTRLSLG